MSKKKESWAAKFEEFPDSENDRREKSIMLITGNFLFCPTDTYNRIVLKNVKRK